MRKLFNGVIVSLALLWCSVASATLYLGSPIEQHVIDAEAKISANCHFPNGRGTDRWSTIFYKEEEGVFFIVKPPVEGWTDGIEGFTQEQMMRDVVISPDTVLEYDW